MSVRILVGDCREQLATLPDGSVHCCVTSPPYFGLRSYLDDDDPAKRMEIGQEPTPSEFIEALVTVSRDVRRTLRDDGTFWLNLGDSYAARPRGTEAGIDKSTLRNAVNVQRAQRASMRKGRSFDGLPHKNLIGIPWRAAFALQEDGWYLRQSLPWVKRNPMPESTRDRPTSSVEYVFMLTKSAHYHFDYEAVRRTMKPSSEARLSQDVASQAASLRANAGGKTNGTMKAVRGDKQRGHSRRHAGFNERWDQMEREEQRGERAFRNSDLFFDSIDSPYGVIGDEDEFLALDVATQGFKAAHFAVFPPRLIEPLIRASCPEGGVVLDPFGGAGTTGLVADRLGRDAILIDLNPEYAEMAAGRIREDAAMLADVTVERAA